MATLLCLSLCNFWNLHVQQQCAVKFKSEVKERLSCPQGEKNRVTFADTCCLPCASETNHNHHFLFFFWEEKCQPKCKVVSAIINFICDEVFPGKKSFPLQTRQDLTAIFLAFQTILESLPAQTCRQAADCWLHCLKFIPLSVLIEFVTIVSGLNQSILLHLLGGKKDSRNVDGLVSCIMDRPIRKWRSSFGLGQESVADWNREGWLHRETMHKVRLMMLKKEVMEKKKSFLCMEKREESIWKTESSWYKWTTLAFLVFWIEKGFVQWRGCCCFKIDKHH